MIKRCVLLLLAAALCVSALAACNAPATDGSLGSALGSKRVSGNRLIGISMPDEEDGRWARDAETMQSILEEQGYLVEVAYANRDGHTQQEQVKALLDDDCNVIIVAPITPAALGEALNSWDTSGTTVISYYGVMADCKAVSYSVALDGYENGKKQGKYLVSQLELEKRTKKNPAHLEIFHLAGSASGEYALTGALEILKPYLDKKVLTIPSGEQTGEDCGVADADETAERVKRLMKRTYADGTSLDAVLCTDDNASVWLAQALEEQYTGSVYPLVAGCNGDCTSIALMLSGRQAMTTVEKGATMPEQAAKMADQVMGGEPVSLTEQDKRNPCDVPAYLYKPYGVSQKSAQKKLFDSGLYVKQKDGTVTVPGQKQAAAKEEKTDKAKAADKSGS